MVAWGIRKQTCPSPCSFPPSSWPRGPMRRTGGSSLDLVSSDTPCPYSYLLTPAWLACPGFLVTGSRAFGLLLLRENKIRTPGEGAPLFPGACLPYMDKTQKRKGTPTGWSQATVGQVPSASSLPVILDALQIPRILCLKAFAPAVSPWNVLHPKCLKGSRSHPFKYCSDICLRILALAISFI